MIIIIFCTYNWYKKKLRSSFHGLFIEVPGLHLINRYHGRIFQKQGLIVYKFYEVLSFYYEIDNFVIGYKLVRLTWYNFPLRK